MRGCRCFSHIFFEAQLGRKSGRFTNPLVREVWSLDILEPKTGPCGHSESGIVLNSAIFSEHWSRNLVATCHFFHPFSVFHTETALWPSKNRNWDFTAPLTKLTESQYCTMSLRQATFFAGWPVGRPGPRPPVRFLTSPWIEATAYDVFSAGRCFTGADAATSSLRVEDMLDRGCGQRACFESLIFTDSSSQVPAAIQRARGLRCRRA